MKSVITERVAKTDKYRVWIEGEYVATVTKKSDTKWMTGDSKNGFNKQLTFKTLKEAARYHA